MALRSLARMQQRQHLQSATSSLKRFHADIREARKGSWSPRAVINEHREELAEALATLTPIIEARVAAGAAFDSQEKAEAAGHYPYNGPGQLPAAQPISSGGLRPQDTGQATAAVDAVARQRAELAGIEEETRLAVTLAPDAEAARKAVAAILARITVKGILRGGGR